MLKLTADHGGMTVYIRAVHIVGIYVETTGETIVDTVSHCYRLTESPEQIMAMPEMQRELNPLVTLSATEAHPMPDSFYSITR